MRRSLAALTPFLCVACSYPSFGFTSAIDSFVDTGTESDSSAEADSALDSIGDASVETPAPTGCAVKHDFCEDFDSVTSPTDGPWSGHFSDGTGAFALDDIVSTSSPNSLRISVPLGSVTESAMLEKSITITSPSTVVRFEADMMIEKLSWPGSDGLVLFKLQHTSAGDGVQLGAAGGNLEIGAETDTGWVAWPLTGITPGKWFHIRIEATLHPTDGTVRAWVDDKQQVDKTGVATANTADLQRTLLVGMFAWKSSTPFRANYDNVSYDAL